MTAQRPEITVTPLRLGFGVRDAVVAWIVHGLSSFFVAWQACQDGDGDWGALSADGVRLAMLVWSAALFVMAAAGWVSSYRNWRRLSRDASPVDSLADDPAEMLALAGTFISTVVLMAFVWAVTPLFSIGVCVTGR